MDPRKAALKEFLNFSENALQTHLSNAAKEGKVPEETVRNSVNTFRERSNLILDTFDTQVQKGGAIDIPTEIPSLNVKDLVGSKAKSLVGSKVNLSKVPSPEEIQKELDKLYNFDPAEHIAEPIKPVVDANIWMFIPEVRDKIKKLIGAFFLLGSLEKLPIFGPLIGSSMDIATAFMPALAQTAQNMLPNLIGLAPIPYAAFAGEAAGYVFSAVMMFMTLMTQVSRGEFLEALEASAGLIPVVGTTLMAYINKGKQVYMKAQAMREKIVKSLAQIQGLALYVLPLVSKNIGNLLQKALPILNTLVKSTAIYVLKPTNFLLENLRPVLASAKARLAQIEAKEVGVNSVKKGGRRYTKKTLRAKRKNRKSRKNTY